MTSPDELLARLRDGSDDSPSARLAALLVDDVLARPLHELVETTAIATATRDALLAWTASDAGAARVVADLERARTLAGAQRGPVGELLPVPVRVALRDLAKLPVVARRDAVLKLVDRPSLRQAIRGQLVRTLVDFGRKVSSPVSDNPIARGLGGLGKLAGQIAKPSPLGAIASAVSGEVERQIDKRASDFADTAVAGILSGIADQASDPANVASQAALRLELLEGLLGLTGADLGALAEGNVAEQVAIARRALAAWAADPAFVATIEGPIQLALALEAARTIGDLLDGLGVRAAVTGHARGFVRRAIGHVVQTEAFATWLSLAMGAD